MNDGHDHGSSHRDVHGPLPKRASPGARPRGAAGPAGRDAGRTLRTSKARAPETGALDAESWLNDAAGDQPLDPLATVSCTSGEVARMREELHSGPSSGPSVETPAATGPETTSSRRAFRIDGDTLKVLVGIGNVVALLTGVFALGVGAAFLVGRASAPQSPPSATARPAAPPEASAPREMPAPAAEARPAPAAAPAAAPVTTVAPGPELPADVPDFHPEARTAPQVATDLGPEEGVPRPVPQFEETSPMPAGLTAEELQGIEEAANPTIVVPTRTPDGGVVYTNVPAPEGEGEGEGGDGGEGE